jgi:hypothetical protein
MLQHASLPVVRSKAPQSPESSLQTLLLEQTHFRTRGGAKPLRPVKLFDETWKAEIIEWVATP